MPDPDTRCIAIAPLPAQSAAVPALRAWLDARPLNQHVPLPDWRCTLQPHGDPADSQHVAAPLGPTGPTVSFCLSAADEPGRAAALRQPAHPQAAELAALLDAPGTTAVHVNDGDELLLLAPHLDTEAADRAARTLAEAFPTVSFLILAGITGAVVMPRRDTVTIAADDSRVLRLLTADRNHPIA